MHLGRPEIRIESGLVSWSVSVTGLSNAPDRLWFRLPEEHSGLVTPLVDPALIALIPPAMHAGRPITVDGSVTDELAHHLTHGYQHILEAVIPGLRRVPLDIVSAVPADDPARGVGTGFSGGIDSFAVLAEHFFQPVPRDLRVTHLALFNVGSLASGELGRRYFRRVHSLLAPAAERMGLPLIPIDSNVDDFYRFAGFVQTHGARNLGTAYLLQRGLGRFVFGSTHPYREVAVRASHSTAYSDPISMPLLQTRQFRPMFHGSQYTRAEKTVIVAGVEESHRSLHVCTTLTADGRNCSRCNKCLRTQLTLELTGHLEQYDGAFELDVYGRVRRAYLDEVAWSRDRHVEELRDFTRSMGQNLPAAGTAYVRHTLRRAARKARSLRRAPRNLG